MTKPIAVKLYRKGHVIDSAQINGRPVLVGRAPGCELVLPSKHDAWHQSLLWTESGMVWIRDLASDQQTYVDEARIVGPTSLNDVTNVRLGMDIRLELCGSAVEPSDYPYRLTVTLQGATGPEALLEDVHSGRQCLIRSNNRVAMLYLLARQHEEINEGESAGEGWCGDETLACGVWGRNWQRQIKSHLYVLVHRIRKEIKMSGLDPQCIEKRRRHTRICVQEVELY